MNSTLTLTLTLTHGEVIDLIDCTSNRLEDLNDCKALSHLPQDHDGEIGRLNSLIVKLWEYWRNLK